MYIYLKEKRRPEMPNWGTNYIGINQSQKDKKRGPYALTFLPLFIGF